VPHVRSALPAVEGVDETVVLGDFGPWVVCAAADLRPLVDTDHPLHPLAHSPQRKAALGGAPDRPVVRGLLLLDAVGPRSDVFVWPPAAAFAFPKHVVTSPAHFAWPPPGLFEADSAEVVLE